MKTNHHAHTHTQKELYLLRFWEYPLEDATICRRVHPSLSCWLILSFKSGLWVSNHLKRWFFPEMIKEPHLLYMVNKDRAETDPGVARCICMRTVSWRWGVGEWIKMWKKPQLRASCVVGDRTLHSRWLAASANLRLTHNSLVHIQTVAPHWGARKKYCIFVKADIFRLWKTHINHTFASSRGRGQTY